jgi:hypothetical protein
MCDHVVGMSILAEMRGLVTQSEKMRYIADARTELLDDAAYRHGDEEKINVLSDDAIFETSTVMFSYCPSCGAQLRQS